MDTARTHHLIRTFLMLAARFVGGWDLLGDDDDVVTYDDGGRTASIVVNYGSKGWVVCKVADSGPGTKAAWTVSGANVNGWAGTSRSIRHAQADALKFLASLNP